MRKQVIIFTEKELTKEERKNYAKEHPGERLCFRLRYPCFPLYLSIVSFIVSMFVLFTRLIL